MKPWYKRATLYAGIALIVAGIGEIVADGETSNGVQKVLEGIGLITLRRAIANGN